jgi:hypothetical protein
MLQNHAHFIVHAGDLDYVDNPQGWDARITTFFGAEFPYIYAIGNHDVPKWYTASTGYQQFLFDRITRVPGLECLGEVGINMLCSYRGVLFLFSGTCRLYSNPN